MNLPKRSKGRRGGEKQIDGEGKSVIGKRTKEEKGKKNSDGRDQIEEALQQ